MAQNNKTTVRKRTTKKVAEQEIPATNIVSAYKAFWKRGFTDWTGTSSRAEYWWAVLANILVACGLIGMYLGFGRAINVGTIGGGMVLLFMLTSALLVLYAVAAIVPSISMVLRRVRDTGLTVWFGLLYPATCLPYVGYLASIALLVIMLLPTNFVKNA